MLCYNGDMSVLGVTLFYINIAGDSGRYFPPNPAAGVEEILFRLLRLFHPRPFILTRFGPQGSAAVVQSSNEKYYNIRFRLVR